VEIDPLAFRSLSKLAIELSPAFGGSSANVSPGLFSAAIVLAHARPNTTRSNKEFAPSRLAP